ncbi:MAG: hypothetical protein QNJ13_06905 [Paracoccaceae bacterium]|nr:hypothetical protein [Paracoccaceae bacterium]
MVRSESKTGGSQVGTLVALTVALALSAGAAAASCSAAARLATLHAAYDDLIEGQGTPRADIGRHVVARELLGPGTDAYIAMLRDRGYRPDLGDVAPALEAMAGLARTGESAVIETAAHRSQRNALAAALWATGCFLPPGAPETEAGPSDDSANRADTDTDTAAAPGPLVRLAGLVEAQAPYSLIVIVAALAGLAGLAVVLRRRSIREKARAYPRCRLGRSVPVTDTKGRAISGLVIDISRGGLMLARPPDLGPEDMRSCGAVLAGTTVEMSLAWHNRHFFGMTFGDPIPEDLLRRILEEAGQGIP